MGAFIAPIVAGLGALTGLFGQKKTTTNQTTNSSTTPVYDPATQSFKDQLMSAFSGETSPSALAQFANNYTTAGVKNIQTGANTAENSIADVLAARGIGRTTAGAQGVGDTTQSEAGNLSTFLNQAPLLLDQRTQGLLSAAGGFLSSLPVGSSTTSNTTGTNVVAPASPVAGLVQGGASTYAGLLGQQSAQNSLANILKSINAPTTVGASAPTTTYTPGSTDTDNGDGY